jgi:DNA transposition AAA+ family ATPase
MLVRYRYATAVARQRFKKNPNQWSQHADQHSQAAARLNINGHTTINNADWDHRLST